MTGEQRFPTKRPKPHENGVLAFTDDWEVWAPLPTESEARQHFDDFDPSLPSAHKAERVTVRLILHGSVAGERVLKRAPAYPHRRTAAEHADYLRAVAERDRHKLDVPRDD